jgi:hypothetical protein
MGKLNAANLEGNFPNYRITVHADSSIDVNSQFLVTGQSYMPLPSDTTDGFAGRPNGNHPKQGMLRWNTTTNSIEMFDGSTWVARS